MEKREIARKAAWLPVAAAAVVLALALAGCTSAPPAPPSDMTANASSAPAAASQPALVQVTRRYVVRRGDTLTAIASANGCSTDDLRTWNDLGSRGRLRIGQVLRIVTKSSVAGANTAATASASIPTPSAASGATAESARPEFSDQQVVSETKRHASRVSLVWPARGNVIEAFKPGANRGIQIAGHAGDPVRAAADGRVMYAGVGLNDYGSLIIVQHNADFLTAYAHNRKLLVKTGDIVHQGQAIAEMGDLDNARVALSFEVRRDGKPVNPLPYLPSTNG
ncbi:peptidoglycan DD-metalloendopeptidase family protein [Burkholderia guangdongensis]|uniref:peptidoglycan DD-metalloendopeptidase family protein n=1 Tax=Burkholderia guangdongensis TaxID=1792500 RepID=UPI0015CACE87|nr:peptidoglycan DD-metalloendopeptidase family protein [Burkholderia guangdongensis]